MIAVRRVPAVIGGTYLSCLLLSSFTHLVLSGQRVQALVLYLLACRVDVES